MSIIVGFFIAVGVLLAPAIPANAQTQGQDPATIVTGIYKKASAGKGDSGGQFLWLNAKDRPRSMSKSLVADDIRGEVEKRPWSVRKMLTEFLKN